jgi:prolyl 4-hydroxylase
MQRPLRASVVHNQEPWLAEYNDWLSADEVKKILKQRKQLAFYEGRVADHATMTTRIDHAMRKANSYKVTDNDQSSLAHLSQRVANFLKLESSNQIEPPVFVQYPQGGHFALHSDRFPIKNSHGEITNRLATMIVYLNNDFEGGQTEFPNIGVTVDPVPGKAILFEHGPNYANHYNPDMMHRGLSVTAGTKYILCFFIRDREFTDNLKEMVRY